MRSAAVSESWTSKRTTCSTEDFFALLDERPAAFLYGNGRFMILAQDPIRILDSLEAPHLEFVRGGDLPPILPDLIGFVCYEASYALEPLAGTPPEPPFPFPNVHLALYAQVRIYDTVTRTLYEGRREAERSCETAPNLLKPGRFSASLIDPGDSADEYRAKVAHIREEIARGNVYQVNLTRQETWRYEGSLRTFAERLFDANPAPFSGLVLGPDFAVISSSPERFLRIESGEISAQPIKGTAPRGATPEEDAALAEELLESPKNRAELAMIVDLLRNDLTRVCRIPSVKVDSFPVLETYANVHHLVASISGELREEVGLPELFAALFPGGSVTGCPKLAAMKLIRRIENRPRLAYTGAMGWLRADLKQADLALPIRTTFASTDSLVLGVGGGIVWDSDPGEEYLETLHKARSILQCLN